MGYAGTLTGIVGFGFAILSGNTYTMIFCGACLVVALTIDSVCELRSKL